MLGIGRGQFAPLGALACVRVMRRRAARSLDDMIATRSEGLGPVQPGRVTLRGTLVGDAQSLYPVSSIGGIPRSAVPPRSMSRPA